MHFTIQHISTDLTHNYAGKLKPYTYFTHTQGRTLNKKQTVRINKHKNCLKLRSSRNFVSSKKKSEEINSMRNKVEKIVTKIYRDRKILSSSENR